MRRIGRQAVCSALLFCLLLAGCGGSPTGQTFRYDISGPVSNLDPQFAVDSSARLVIGNLYEGLLVLHPDGELEPGVAEAYVESPSGTAYTFQLREALWSDGETPVTAHDFVFALQRLFNRSAVSPWAEDYLCIKNARAVLAGEAEASSLGVRALDDRTLSIELDYPNPLFLELLASTPAMPCNEEFFQESGGRYGLEIKYILSNGPFDITGWNNERSISLRQNVHYISERPVLAGGVTLYIDREDPAGQLLGGNSDLAEVSVAQYQELQQENRASVQVDKTTWCIVFNQNDEIWSNALLRQALFHAIDYEALDEGLAEHLTASNVLAPSAMMLGGASFRELAGLPDAVTYDPDRAMHLLELGMDSMEVNQLPSVTFYVPSTDEHSSYMSLVQRDWQKNLSVFINMENLLPSQLQEKLLEEDYQMMLYPFTPAGAGVDSILGVFTTDSGQNYFQYHNPIYDSLLEEAREQKTLEDMAQRYAMAEWQILSDAVVIPVYTETTYFVMGKGVSGIDVFPYGGMVYFKYGIKE